MDRTEEHPACGTWNVYQIEVNVVNTGLRNVYNDVKKGDTLTIRPWW